MKRSMGSRRLLARESDLEASLQSAGSALAETQHALEEMRIQAAGAFAATFEQWASVCQKATNKARVTWARLTNGGWLNRLQPAVFWWRLFKSVGRNSR
eukprot:scaffold226674_cov18-Tisochrysis_lutea.AAC.1